MPIDRPASEMPAPKIPAAPSELSPSEIIDRLGGTSAVARLFNIKPPSVSDWRLNGIPQTAIKFLWLAYPEVMSGKVRYVKVRKSIKEKKE